jgi:hypothetical protein
VNDSRKQELVGGKNRRFSWFQSAAKVSCRHGPMEGLLSASKVRSSRNPYDENGNKESARADEYDRESIHLFNMIR